MAEITNKVGDGAVPNKVHDVALIQAVLRVLKNKQGQPYLPYPYDGNCGMHTKEAIKAFQIDQGTAEPPWKKAFTPTAPQMTLARRTAPEWAAPSQVSVCLATDTDPYGVVTPDGPTMAKLNALLPPSHRDIRTIPEAHVVYWPGSSKAASSSAAEIEGDSQLNKNFRKALAELVRRMFDRHKIVLSLTENGGRRTFQQQYQILVSNPGATNAGPGESNHNFGQGADIGFNGLQWMNGSGHSVPDDDWWLNKLNKSPHSSWCLDLWKVRNAIACGELGLFKSNKPGDHIHIQLYSDDNVSMVKSLAKLLDKVGKMNWRRHAGGYETDLGLGGPWRHVGSAKTIWEGSGPMDDAWLPTGKVGAGPMREALKNEFKTAEAKCDQWTPEPH